ncbi:MAG: SDR family NAD(P)-dependent oxidoreductase [Actinobacteria bacterium]|nr:SDR family NAD(P)-dependent oxidoreductase [Actinomycetota bacterium]
MAEALSKAALITGCSSGIGHETAARLASSGWTVYATARSADTIADLADRGCRTMALDVLDEGSMRAAVQQVEREEGAVGVLVNNAGYGQSGAVEAVPIDLVRRNFETNVFGYLRMAQLVLPGMRRQGWGRIVNLSSVAGRVTMPGSGIYSSTKFAIRAMTDALRFEVRGFGVDVVLVEPGPIRTRFTESANSGMPDGSAADGTYAAYHETVAKADADADRSTLLAGDPEDVAKVIERAISSRRPRARYRVTIPSRLLPALRGALPDRAFDAFLRTQAAPPGG